MGRKGASRQNRRSEVKWHGKIKHRTDVKSQSEVEAVKLFDAASGGVSASRRGFVWATKEAGA